MVGNGPRVSWANQKGEPQTVAELEATRGHSPSHTESTTMPLFAARPSTQGPAADHPGQERKGYWVLKDVVEPSHDTGHSAKSNPIQQGRSSQGVGWPVVISLCGRAHMEARV